MQDIRNFNVKSYGWYSSDNYGAHSLLFETPQGDFWFSYSTLIAFRVNGEFHIVKNYWGKTTGKHLNWICNDKSIREDKETFEQNLQRCMNSILKQAV